MSLLSNLNTLRETTITNLQGKGISEATTSMGLTTLVGKISDIVQGEKYTVTTPTSKLTKMYVNERIPISVNISKDNVPKDNLKVYLMINDTVYEDTRKLTNSNGDATLDLKIGTAGTYNVKVFVDEFNVSDVLSVTIINPDYYVSIAGNDSNDGLSLSTAFLTLNKAVTTATNGNGIFVQSGTYNGTSNTALTISKNLTIYSENAIFDGASTRQSGFIVPTGYNLVLNGLTFSNGNNYGALNLVSNNLVLYCNFKTNKKSTTYTDWDKPSCCGGGAYVSGEKNIFYACGFSGNTSYDGGAIYFDNSSNYNSVGDCGFTGNTSSNGGGAISFYSNSNNSIGDCGFTGNTSSNYGGAISFYGHSNYNSVGDCGFSGNTSSSNGGAISFYSSYNNSVGDCGFSGNTSSNYGGAIYFNSSSNNSVGDCGFTGNTSYDGGAIYFNNSSNYNSVGDCGFSGNTSSNYGGAIYFNSSSNNSVGDCGFIKNKTQNIYVNNTTSTGTFTNCYWGTNTPATSDYGTIQNMTVTSNATTSTVYNLFKHTPTTVSTGTKVNLTLICRDVYGEPLSNMTLTLKDGTSTLATLTTDNNGLSTYSVTVTASMSLTITNTAKDNYNSCTSETRTITLA